MVGDWLGIFKPRCSVSAVAQSSCLWPFEDEFDCKEWRFPPRICSVSSINSEFSLERGVEPRWIDSAKKGTCSRRDSTNTLLRTGILYHRWISWNISTSCQIFDSLLSTNVWVISTCIPVYQISTRFLCRLTWQCQIFGATPNEVRRHRIRQVTQWGDAEKWHVFVHW